MVWICTKRNENCNARKISEHEIIEASRHFLGEYYQGKVVEYIDKIYVKNDDVSFVYKDWIVKIWQRK